jgi:hypothetical protein
MANTTPSATGDNSDGSDKQLDATGRPQEEDPCSNITFELLFSKPSENYKIKERTLVYRLSELTFGSILAAYILGFISFAATSITSESRTPIVVKSSTSIIVEAGTPVVVESGTPVVESATPIIIDYFKPTRYFWSVVLQVLIYVLISGTFAYLTAGIYMHYHLGILTTPGQVEWSRLDFTIAVGQAVLFGISMLSPPLFIICVAIVLWLAIWRQGREFSSLAKKFKRELQLELDNKYPSQPKQAKQSTPMSRSFEDAQEKAQKKKQDEKEEKLLKSIKENIKTSGPEYWRPVTIWPAILLTIVGILLLLLDIVPPLKNDFPFLDFPEFLLIVYSTTALFLFLLVWLNAHTRLKEGSKFINAPGGPTSLDTPYCELEIELQKVKDEHAQGWSL